MEQKRTVLISFLFKTRKRENTNACLFLLFFFLLCRWRFARGETQSLRFSSLYAM